MDTTLKQAIERRGFCLDDCPYSPVQPAWDGFPIVRAIRDAEQETGKIYEHTPEAPT
jgi:hypothetical protein